VTDGDKASKQAFAEGAMKGSVDLQGVGLGIGDAGEFDWAIASGAVERARARRMKRIEGPPNMSRADGHWYSRLLRERRMKIQMDSGFVDRMG
jgi:hypothetical protein